MIQFPCPKSTSSMKPIYGGFYCDYCEKKVYDLGEVGGKGFAEWRRNNPSSCVSVVSSEDSSGSFSISKFALVLLIVGGTTFFSNLSAQMEDTLNLVKGNVVNQENHRKLTVNLFDKQGYGLFGSAWAILPNGKELELLEGENGEYAVVLPEYCEGKEVEVYADYNGEVGKKVIVINSSDDQRLEFVFKTKRYRRHKYRTSGY